MIGGVIDKNGWLGVQPEAIVSWLVYIWWLELSNIKTTVVKLIYNEYILLDNHWFQNLSIFDYLQ